MRRFALRPAPRAAANERGNPTSSFDALILPHLDGAYNLARFLTRDEAMSEDVVQDAVLRAFRSFDQFRGDSPRAWLFAIVRNCCRTALGARNVAGLRLIDEAANESATDADEGDNPEQALIRASDAAMVRALVEALPEPFREAIVLRDLEGLSTAEVARAMGTSEATVRSHIWKARTKVREFAERYFRRR